MRGEEARHAGGDVEKNKLSRATGPSCSPAYHSATAPRTGEKRAEALCLKDGLAALLTVARSLVSHIDSTSKKNERCPRNAAVSSLPGRSGERGRVR
jgi:hypothetical protein